MCGRETTQLKLDYDCDVIDWWRYRHTEYKERMRQLAYILNIRPIEQKFYRSKSGHIHVRVWLEGWLLSPLETSVLQAVLGSDPVREIFNLRRIRAGQRNWNLLFNTSESYEELK